MEVKQKIFGYARTSTREQNEDRVNTDNEKYIMLMTEQNLFISQMV